MACCWDDCAPWHHLDRINRRALWGGGAIHAAQRLSPHLLGVPNAAARERDPWRSAMGDRPTPTAGTKPDRHRTAAYLRGICRERIHLRLAPSARDCVWDGSAV